VTSRVLILGASGLVGSHLLDAFADGWEVTGTCLRHPRPGLVPLNLTDAGAVDALVRDVRPDAILCPASEANVDRCEQDPESTRRVNVGGTRAVADAARARGALLAWFSTDYVFDGERGPYAEDAPCLPVNEYGRQKVACEELVRALPRHLVLRVSAVYGWEWERKNYVVRLIERLTAGERAKAWTDQVLTPTYAPNLARMVRELVEAGVTGTFHACGGAPTDRYTFSKQICEAFGLDAARLEPVTSAEFQPTPTPRPRKPIMRTEKIRAAIRTQPMTPPEGLRAMRDGQDSDPRAAR
jgi:dTDP-4-dehydrorhamnose reductase